MEGLAGKVALVTGGGRGIGRATALGLARAGCHVAVAARTRAEVDEVAAEVRALGAKAHAFTLDVADRAALAAAPGEVARALGPVDVLVNNAGIAESEPLHRMTDAHWDRHLAIDLTAPFLLTRACLGGMYERRFGRVLNVASIAGLVGFPYTAAYCAAKHGLIGLTKTLAMEGARKGVLANAVCPGWVETDMAKGAVENMVKLGGRTEAEARAELAAQNPGGRLITPGEVAKVAVELIAGGQNGEIVMVGGE